MGTPSQTVSYGYGNSNWGDLLTSYNGKTMSYDAIGNLTSDGTWSYSWSCGRELERMSMNGGSTTWVFTYDANGMRTKRTNGSTTYTYIYNGSQLSQMTMGSTTMYFIYDANGLPMAFTFNGTQYFYVTNLQGDIEAILDTAGNLVVKYVYNAWGELISTTGSLASTYITVGNNSDNSEGV